jgi:hypothetical protein
MAQPYVQTQTLTQTKYCPGCRQTKSVSKFSKKRTAKDGLQSECKNPCASESSRRWRAENPEKNREIDRRWAEKNPEVHILRYAIRRCHDPEASNFENYGAKGVYVDDRYRGPDGVANLIADIGRRPSKDHQLDRIAGGNSPYAPRNIRWVTKEENIANRSCTVWIEFEGERHCFKQLHRKLTEAGRCAASHETVRGRLKRGWTVEKAFLHPPDPAQSARATAYQDKLRAEREAAAAVELAASRKSVKKMLAGIDADADREVPAERVERAAAAERGAREAVQA